MNKQGRSSVVEQRPFKPKVVGSIPTAPTNISFLDNRLQLFEGPRGAINVRLLAPAKPSEPLCCSPLAMHWELPACRYSWSFEYLHVAAALVAPLDRHRAHEATLNGYGGTCASRSGLSLLSRLRGLASSPVFGLANMVFPSRRLRTPNPPTSPAEPVLSCVDVASPQANGREASTDETPAFSHRPAYRRRMLGALPSAVHPSRCHAISVR